MEPPRAQRGGRDHLEADPIPAKGNAGLPLTFLKARPTRAVRWPRSLLSHKRLNGGICGSSERSAERCLQQRSREILPGIHELRIGNANRTSCHLMFLCSKSLITNKPKLERNCQICLAINHRILALVCQGIFKIPAFPSQCQVPASLSQEYESRT